jgi:hypothetical protein
MFHARIFITFSLPKEEKGRKNGERGCFQDVAFSSTKFKSKSTWELGNINYKMKLKLQYHYH